jgi:hypothetical protein
MIITDFNSLPDPCKNCVYRVDKSKSFGNHTFDECSHHTNDNKYLYCLFTYRSTESCPHSCILTVIKNNWLWLRMYNKGLEKAYVRITDKEKALVRANWFVMKIAYIADWVIKKQDERMAKRKLLYNVKQAVNQFISARGFVE